MPAEFTYLVDKYITDMHAGLALLVQAGDALSAGSSWLAIHDYVTASGFYDTAGVKLKAGAAKLYTARPWPASSWWRKDMLYWIDANISGGGGGTTMSDMLTAMLAASFEELTQFMGITQAYKVAVWDAPFNEEYYAALARGFKTWGT